MIYPSYGTTLTPTRHEEALGILSILKSLHIKNVPNIYCTFFVNGYSHQAFRDNSQDVEYLSSSEFLKVYTDFHKRLLDFLNSLQIGSKVILSKRHLPAHEYPFTYSTEMEEQFAEKEFIIKQIRSASDYGVDIEHCIAFNGDSRIFFLEGCGGYKFHSSMFCMEPVIPIKTIELSSINIDLGF